ncbi:cilia- and flagella-associated protein 44 isoform X2 [Microplitis mediator]|uniref:cilia- and flagella-associated protein 44 isoform X2 n=1 Tax=Microplitis mediator TaxID=375433 RepID=UPI002553D752|nr:cilia- and flagella-associated protein 44 isoform X2 [Microplitis mediator]
MKIEMEDIEYDDKVLGVKISKNGTLKKDFLEFFYSYGYNCRRYFNICVADPDTVIFASGCWVNIFDVKSGELRFRRCCYEGIGHIAKNPTKPHIAIAETGTNPPIIIYSYPNFEIITKLLNGTMKKFSHLSYNSNGDLLVSQGGEPDYSLIIWDWASSKIKLRCQSHNSEVYNVVFSSFMPENLVTSGSGHIKFWKMVDTFTGLKLQGSLGRFGSTESCDIIGIFCMPDGKVVSGCEWGNILLWTQSLISLEVRRKNKKPCHDNMITQFEFNNGELMSIGMDGWIKIWYYDSIDNAQPSEENPYIEIEPIYEFRIFEQFNNNINFDSMLMCIKKKINDFEDTFWYGQDGNGGLWLIDLSTLNPPTRPQKLLTCHASAIADIATSTWSNLLASCGDSRLNIHDYLKKKLIITYKFNDSCTQVIWVPCSIDPTGSTLICSFTSGIIRILVINFNELINESDTISNNNVYLTQIIKPHTKKITTMSMNPSKRLLVTGSKDLTIFIFHINNDKLFELVAIGYINLPAVINCVNWNPEFDGMILLGCMNGYFVEIKLPETRPVYTKISYELVECKFRTFKIEIKNREIKIENNENNEQQYKSEKIISDSGDIYKIPDIITINYMDDKIWLTMSDDGKGFIYELILPKDEEFEQIIYVQPERVIKIFEDENEEVYSWFFYDEYLILGLESGKLKICHLNKNDPTNLSDYWLLPIHENSNGQITKILLSYDKKMLFTSGCDGNIFSFVINNDNLLDKKINFEKAQKLITTPKIVEDIEDNYPSLEEVIKKKEQDRVLNEAKKRKQETLEILERLRNNYCQIIIKNNELVKSQQLTQDELELDPRITEDLNRELKEKLDSVYKKYEFDLEKSKLGLKKLMDFFIKPITCVPFAVCRILKSDSMVHSLRERKLADDFNETYDSIVKQSEERKINIRTENIELNDELIEDGEEIKIEGVESFLKGLNPDTVQYKLGAQINQMLKKYRERKARNAQRAQEWKLMEASKPDTNADNEEDVKAVEEAKKTIGDYKLKISNNYNYNENFKVSRDTTISKHKQLLDCRKKAHLLRESFNERLKNIRSKKMELQNEVVGLIDKLKFIHTEIPEKYIKPLPSLLEINYDIEFPERNLELEKYKSLSEKFNESRNKQYSKSSTESQAQEFKLNKKLYDDEYEILLLNEKIVNNQLNMFDPELENNVIKKSKLEIKIPMEKMEEMKNFEDRELTAWEQEMKLARVAKKIYEQDCIINYINNSYRNIDLDLDKLEQERLEIKADSIYSELYQLTLHQELIILKDFEEKENLLISKVDDHTYQRDAIKQKIQKLSNNIDIKNKEISKITDKIKELNKQFINMTSENKFSEYLKKIYRKKFKFTRITDESSESSTSESSSDEDNQLSTEDENFDYLNLDENTCPIGCDEELYKLSFSMRTKRHKFENQMRDDQKILEDLRKQLDQNKKKLKIIESNLNLSERELQDYMREKQKKLNEIDVTVILKLHQLQHIDNDSLVKISDCVVFDRTQLSRLYTRVGELQQETTDQKIKHKKNRQHLHRVEIDCDYMESEIKRLKEEIKKEMIQKFGKEISLTSLYEAVLRRMIYNIKADIKEMIKSYDKEINEAKKKYREQVLVLENLIRDNTEKLGLMTALEEEQRKLRKILKHNPEDEEKIKKVEKEYQEELAKLEKILKTQRQQKELFRNEIRNLRLKSRPLPPVYQRKFTKVLSLDEDFKLREDFNSLEFNNEAGIKDKNNYQDNDLISIESDEINTEIKKFLNKIYREENYKESLEELLSNLKINKNIVVIKKINKLIKLNITDGKKYQLINKYIEEIILRLESELESAESNLSLNWDVKPKIDELLSSMAIKRDSITLISLINYLREEDSVEKAVDYLVNKLSSTDSDVTMALRDYASKMLSEIKINIEASQRNFEYESDDNEEASEKNSSD